MADDFIPLNQSTPQGKPNYNHGFNQNNSGRQQNRKFQGRNRRGSHNNRWGNNSRSSYGSDSNSSFSRSQDQSSIDAYLHPAMLQDPWERLRQQQNSTN